MDFDKLKNKLETVYSDWNEYVSEKLQFEYSNDKYKLLLCLISKNLPKI